MPEATERYAGRTYHPARGALGCLTWFLLKSESARGKGTNIYYGCALFHLSFMLYGSVKEFGEVQ